MSIPAGGRAARPVDVTVTIVELVLLTVLAMIVSYFGFFVALAADGCGSGVECDDGLILAGLVVAVAAPWPGYLLVLVWSIARMARRRLAFWVPWLAVPAWAVLALVGVLLADAGVPS